MLVKTDVNGSSRDECWGVAMLMAKMKRRRFPMMDGGMVGLVSNSDVIKAISI